MFIYNIIVAKTSLQVEIAFVVLGRRRPQLQQAPEALAHAVTITHRKVANHQVEPESQKKMSDSNQVDRLIESELGMTEIISW
jgi:hypothetical protein